jgi:hypothetical protein
MKTYLSKIPDLPLIVRYYGEDFDTARDMARLVDEDTALLDAQTEQVYLAMVVQEIKFAIADMLQGVNILARQKNLFKHPRIIESIMVGTQKPLEMVAKGMASPVFGRIAVKVMPNLEATYDYVRQQVNNK